MAKLVSQKLLEEYRVLKRKRSEADKSAREYGKRIMELEEIFGACKWKAAPGKLHLIKEVDYPDPRLSKANIIEVKGEGFYDRLIDSLKDEIKVEKIKIKVLEKDAAEIAKVRIRGRKKTR